MYKPLVCCNSPHLCVSKSLNIPVWLVRLEYYKANYRGLCCGVSLGDCRESGREYCRKRRKWMTTEKEEVFWAIFLQSIWSHNNIIPSAVLLLFNMNVWLYFCLFDVVGRVGDVKIDILSTWESNTPALLFPYRRALILSTLERGKVLSNYRKSSQSPSGLNSVKLTRAFVLSVLVYEHFLL